MLHELLKPTLDFDRERPILESQGTWTTAGELEKMTSRLASGLVAAGLEEGDRVAVLLPNCREAVVCYLACFRLNLVMLPLDYRHHPIQIGYVLGHSGASILIVQNERIEVLAAAGVLAGMQRVVTVGGESASRKWRTFESLLGAEREVPTETPPEDSAGVMIYTSGTTSRPKGVKLSHGALAAGLRKFLARVTLGPDDVALIAAPITRPMALRTQLLPTLWARGRISLLGQFQTDDYVSALRSPPSKTFLALLPGALRQVVDHPEFGACDFGRLRLCLAGGDHVPIGVQESFAAVTGVSVTELCGASETGPYAMNPPFGRRKPGSIGLPMHGVQVAVVDEQDDELPTGMTGQMLVSGSTIMDGYWNDCAMTRKNLRRGWVRTGDLGRFDEDGYLWFMGRKKDLILRGGSNISPVEVEAAIAEHPGVLESCVIGVPDPLSGQAVLAHVVFRPDSSATPADVLAFLRARLAEYMVPAEIHRIAELPLKGPGKIDREMLRMRSIIAPLIQRVPFFRDASPGFIRDMVPKLESRRFAPGEILVHEGDIGDEMYFLTQGKVEVLQAQGPAVAVLREGDAFGEVAILKDVPRTATVRALETCEVYALGRAGVLGLVDAYPEFGLHLRKAMEQHSP